MNEPKHPSLKIETPHPAIKLVRHYRDLIERSLFALQTMQHAPALRVELSGALAQDPDEIDHLLALNRQLVQACDIGQRYIGLIEENPAKVSDIDWTAIYNQLRAALAAAKEHQP